MSDSPRSNFWRYGGALAALLLATVLRVVFDAPLREHLPFLTYYGAVLFAAWHAGLGPSVATLLSGAVIGVGLFISSSDTSWYLQPEHHAEYALYLLVGGVVIALAESLRAQQRRAEAARGETEYTDNLLTAVLSHTHMLVACMDRDFNFVLVNRAYAAADGRQPADFPGKNHFDLYPHEENQAIFRRVVETGEPYFCHAKPFEYRQNPERGVSYWDWGLIPITDGAGRVEMLVMTLLDVTRRIVAEESVRRNVERLELLSEVSSRLLASDKPQEVVESLCRRVMAHLDSHAFFNYLLDEGRQQLHLNACAGVPAETAREIEWLESGVAVCGCVARDGCRIVAENVQESSDDRVNMVRSFGIRAYACHPLLNQGRVIGTLSFGSRSKDRFREDELALMKAVTDQVAVAMQRLHLLESLEHRVAERTAEAEERADQLRWMATELAHAEQRERRRLALILHDHLQQILVAARMKISQVRRRAAEQGIGPLVEDVDRLIHEAIAESRSLTLDLSPPVLYDGGLVSGLTWLARHMKERHGLPVEVRAAADAEPADEATRVFLFQAVRELLFNAVKHAHAECVRVQMSRNGEQISVEVCDNGRGFDASDLGGASRQGGFGLFSVRERLKTIGGRMDIRTAPGEGTRVAIFLPNGRVKSEG